MTPTIGQRVQTTPAYHAELGRLFPLAKVPAFSVGTVRRIICRRAKDTVVDVAFDGYATFMLSTDWLTPTPKEGRTMTIQELRGEGNRALPCPLRKGSWVWRRVKVQTTWIHGAPTSHGWRFEMVRVARASRDGLAVRAWRKEGQTTEYRTDARETFVQPTVAVFQVAGRLAAGDQSFTCTTPDELLEQINETLAT